MPTLTIDLPALHQGQRMVADSRARFRVLAAGRRWGKTRMGTALCIATALKGGRAWWVAPSYKMAAVGWRGISQLAQQIPGAAIKRGDRVVEMPTGGTVQVRSADNPDSLRGEGLDFSVMDECAFMRREAWEHAIRPALSDRRGRAMFISTPKGRNWFWEVWARGQREDNDVWQSWQLPTSENPYIVASEIEAARQSMPERIFRQEYLAEFIDDAGGVFRHVADAATAIEKDVAENGHHYVIGVDWARSNDYTVMIVIDADEKAVVYMERLGGMEYGRQIGILRGLVQRFAPDVVIAELNSMGGPLVESLQRDGMPVQGFTTTNASKSQAIDALALAFDNFEISIIPDPVLVSELQAFEGKRLQSGAMRYEAPSGLHDDTVMALALAWSAVADAGPLVLW